METISTILSALANTDSGTVTVPLDSTIYPQDVVRSFAASCPSCHAVLVDAPAVLMLTLTASDPVAGRMQIGNALTDLLQLALGSRV